MSTIFTREATAEEVCNEVHLNLMLDRPVRFRHFVRETAMVTARNGVQHRQYSRSKVTLIGGVPHVKYNGKLEQLTGTVYRLPGGRETVFDLRIKSEYLK